MTDGSERQKTALREAAGWYALLCSDDVTEQQKAEYRAWLNRAQENEQAWQQIETLRQQLQSVPGSPSYQALDARRRQGGSRRAVLRSFALLATGAGVAGLAWKTTPLGLFANSLMASHQTGRGERGEYTFADGSRVLLNTATSMDIVETADARFIRLYDGEIHVRTGTGKRPAGKVRTLQVHTEHGTVVPLGTVFTVRKQKDVTRVVVFQDQVELIPARAGGVPTRVSAGSQAHLGVAEVAVSPAPAQADSWIRGLLVAVDWPLERLVSELSRYRTGVMRCDPGVARLRVSGAFPVDDTERALRAVTNALPVKVERVTDYWVTLTAR